MYDQCVRIKNEGKLKWNWNDLYDSKIKRERTVLCE